MPRRTVTAPGKKPPKTSTGGGRPTSDTTPNAFTFTPVIDAELSTVTTSNAVTILGIDATVSFSVTDGEAQKNSTGDWLTSGTVVSGDTLRVRLTSSGSNSTVETATVTVGGVSGTFSVTTEAASPPAGTLVTTLAELQTALTSAVGGDVIRVAPGAYAYALIQNKVYASDVTIIAGDESDPPVFAGMTLKSCTNVRVEGIEATPGGAPLAGIMVLTSTGVTVTDCLCRGPDAAAFTTGASGIFARGSTDTTISNNECKWTQFGISHLDCDTLVISGNHVHTIRTDAIRGGGSNDVTVSANLIHDFYPQALDHADGIQFWTTNVTRLTENITVEDNLIYRGAGSSTIHPQGVFFRDQAGSRYSGVTITGNAVVGGTYNGICMQGYTLNGVPTYSTGVVINDNFILGFADQRSWLRITLTDGSSYADNQYSYLANQANTSLTIGSGNVKLTEATALGDYALLDAWLVTHPDVPARA
jgi:hypothetical protein